MTEQHSRLLRLAVLGLLTAFPLLFASVLPALWVIAPVSVAAWAALALEPAPRARPALWVLFAAAWAFYGIGQRFFLAWGTAAWLLVTLYQALLTVLPALALRRVCARFPRLPLGAVVPVTWIAGEFLRAQGPFGLPSGSLALPLSEKPLLMQTADLGGLYFVSLPLAATAGLLTEAFLNRERPREDRRPLLPSAAGVAALWCFALGYGAFRLREGAHTITPALRAAVVQTDGPTDLRTGLVSPQQLSAEVMADTNAAIASARARREPPPSLVVWPEDPGFPPLTREFLSADPSADRLLQYGMTPRDFAQYRALAPFFGSAVRGFGGASLLYGCAPPEPDATAPDGWRQYNTAALWLPDGTPYAVRQNKVHPAPFGEYLPGIPYGEIPPALHRLLPEVQNLSAGDRRVLFSLPNVSKGDGTPLRFAVVICNEIALPTTAGVFGGDPATFRGADFLAVMANEGSFGRGDLPQYSQRVCAYRAIEARVGIARSANAGISGFYKPDGTFYGAVRNAKGESQTGQGFPEQPLIAEAARLWRENKEKPDAAAQKRIADLQGHIAALRAAAGIRGASLQTVYTDTRAGNTVYARCGDWFGGALLAVSFAGMWLPLTKTGAARRRS